MKIVPPPETVLHLIEQKRWFKTRHPQKVKERYKKTTKELVDDQIVTDTFHLIDRDHSNTIELDELYTMLKKNNYPVNTTLLKQFFEKTDRDGNKCIDLEEFKQVLKDESTTQCFRTMMRKMREIGSENYYSTDFVNLLRYLSYCSNRTDLIWQIKNQRLTFDDRSKLVTQLLNVNEEYANLNKIQLNTPKTLKSFQKRLSFPEIKYMTPRNTKNQQFYQSQMSTRTNINTSQQNSMSSFQIPTVAQLTPKNSVKLVSYTFRKRTNQECNQ